MRWDKFSWDDAKRESNLQKHRIDFIDIAQSFSEFIYHKESHRNEEERHQAIGKLLDIYVTVVYTIRENTIRIISARKARKNEKKYYKDLYTHRS